METTVKICYQFHKQFFFLQLTKINLAAQKTEEELRDELSKCVTKAVSDIDKRKIVDLEKSNHTLSLENERLKVWQVECSH